MVRRVCRVEEEIKMQMKKAMRIMGLCCVSALLVACGQTVVGTDEIDVRSCRKLTAQSKLSEKLEKSRFLHFKFEQ